MSEPIHSTPKPDTVEAALQQHWEAKHALAYWKQRELDCRLNLADFLCPDGNGSYANKTLALGDGTKLVMEVKRTIKVDPKHDSYMATMQSVVQHKALTDEQLAAFRKEKRTVEFSLSGFNALPQQIKDQLGESVRINETLSIDYKRPTENR